MKINILYEDNHLLVVEKPINIPVQEDNTKDKDLLTILKDYIKEKYNKPGNVYLGLVHRLDRPAGGVMVFARTSKAASRLSDDIRLNKITKIYNVVCEGNINKEGKLIDKLYKDTKNNIVKVDDRGKESMLNYKKIDYKNNLSLVEIELETGRSHQIRVQMSHAGFPLYGDQKYNKNSKVGEQLALFAKRLEFNHPTTKEHLVFELDLPDRKPFNIFKKRRIKMEEEFNNDINYLDQHFLIDKSVINKFVDACNISINDDIVEIGPGKGTISEYLARKANHLTCIEIDRNLEHYMSVLSDKFDNVDVLYGNALNVFIPDCTKIVSALPYSITEPFIEKLLRCNFEESILIVGKRFADAVIEGKIEKLSLLTNCFFKVEKIDDIEPDAFEPAPRVMSSIIKLTPIKRSELSKNFKMFVFREIFFRRGKKLKNDLMEALISFASFHDKKLTKKESKKVIEDYNIDKNILNKRIESLSNEEIQIIYDTLR